ncbi:hypothetical protein, partial [Novacetimonas hansenii]|uniref:hypothetical protein n=1 Tax=Novacetimonas hansenii TaxID=436 RepID=UPI001A7E3ED6
KASPKTFIITGCYQWSIFKQFLALNKHNDFQDFFRNPSSGPFIPSQDSGIQVFQTHCDPLVFSDFQLPR